MTAVSAPGKFVQTWRAPTWPDGHFGQLTATLDQGSGSTTLHIDLEGVPVGKEDETEQGIEVYYIRSLKVRHLSLPHPALSARMRRLTYLTWLKFTSFTRKQQIGSVLASRSASASSSTISRILAEPVPAHPWDLPGFAPVPYQSLGARLLFRLTATASVLASVLLPIGAIAFFVWLLYNGPTMKE